MLKWLDEDRHNIKFLYVFQGAPKFFFVASLNRIWEVRKATGIGPVFTCSDLWRQKNENISISYWAWISLTHKWFFSLSAYLCIASNGVSPKPSRRIRLDVMCEFIRRSFQPVIYFVRMILIRRGRSQFKMSCLTHHVRKEFIINRSFCFSWTCSWAETHRASGR